MRIVQHAIKWGMLVWVCVLFAQKTVAAVQTGFLILALNALYCAVLGWLISKIKVHNEPKARSFFITVAHLLWPLLFQVQSDPSLVALLIGQLTLTSGLILAVFALTDLGESFDLLPSKQEVKADGLYRFVRHPIYAAYCLIGLGNATANFSLLNTAIFIGLLALTVARIREEEETLGAIPAYQSYRSTVRYRLLPGVY